MKRNVKTSKRPNKDTENGRHRGADALDRNATRSTLVQIRKVSGIRCRDIIMSSKKRVAVDPERCDNDGW